MTALFVTVIIVNYNGVHLLSICFDVFDTQRVDVLLFEIVVVDNASRDGLIEMLVIKYFWVIVIASLVNMGFVGGNNFVFWWLRILYVVLLNNDVVFELSWLARLLVFFDAPGGERLGVTSGKVLFMLCFVCVSFEIEGFRFGVYDGWDLGVRIYRIEVDDVEVTLKVLWEQSAYGFEQVGDQHFWWICPSGELLVFVLVEYCCDGVLDEPLRLSVCVAAE